MIALGLGLRGRVNGRDIGLSIDILHCHRGYGIVITGNSPCGKGHTRVLIERHICLAGR